MIVNVFFMVRLFLTIGILNGIKYSTKVQLIIIKIVTKL